MSKILTHVALHALNRAESEKFYSEWAGMRDASPDVSQKSPWLSSPGKEGVFSLVLVPTAKQQHQQPVTNVTRLGFAVESLTKLRSLYTRAVANSNVLRPLDESPNGRATFCLRDPNGWIDELFVPKNPPLHPIFNNISLHVRDMTVSQEFYREWCDMNVSHYGQVSRSCRMVTPGQSNPFQLILCDGAATTAGLEKSNISHIGIATATMEELQTTYERAQQAGIVERSLITLPYPAGTLFFAKDPDGNNVEFSYGQPLGPGMPQVAPA